MESPPSPKVWIALLSWLLKQWIALLNWLLKRWVALLGWLLKWWIALVGWLVAIILCFPIVWMFLTSFKT